MFSYSYPYRVLQPHPLLQPYIECYRMDRKSGPLDKPMPRRIMPDGSAHLIFYVYGLHGDVLRQGYDASHCRLRLVGARSVYTDIEQRQRALTLIVRFRPGGAWPFFPVSAFELADRGVDIEALWGARAGRQLIERLARAQHVAGQIKVLEDVFLHRLTTSDALDPLVQEALAWIHASHPRPTLRGLADEVGVGERHLRNRFRRSIGLGPKTYTRVLRVRHVIQRAALGVSFDWPDLALAAGFYDQAHMIRDFQALLGEAPVTFMKRLEAVVPNRTIHAHP